MGKRWRCLLAASAPIALLAVATPAHPAEEGGSPDAPGAGAVPLDLPTAGPDPDHWSAGRPALDLGSDLGAGPARDDERAGASADDGLLGGELEAGTAPEQRWLDLPLAPLLARLAGGRSMLAPVSIYLSGGAGPSHAALDAAEPDADLAAESGLAYRAGAGLAYRLTEGVTFSAGWRYDYVDEHPPPFGPGSGLPFDERAIAIEGHQLVGGLRIDYHVAPLEALLPRH